MSILLTYKSAILCLCLKELEWHMAALQREEFHEFIRHACYLLYMECTQYHTTIPVAILPVSVGMVRQARM